MGFPGGLQAGTGLHGVQVQVPSRVVRTAAEAVSSCQRPCRPRRGHRRRLPSARPHPGSPGRLRSPRQRGEGAPFSCPCRLGSVWPCPRPERCDSGVTAARGNARPGDPAGSLGSKFVPVGRAECGRARSHTGGSRSGRDKAMRRPGGDGHSTRSTVPGISAAAACQPGRPCFENRRKSAQANAFPSP